MILSAQSIRQRCVDRIGQPSMLTPFAERTVAHGMTYGLGPAGFDIRIAEEMILGRGQFALASSIERFAMPKDVLGRVADKSTWARRGLMAQNTVIEPGWRGHLTLELTNQGPSMVHLVRGMPIVQIIFEFLDQPTDSPYDGKYQNQVAAPVPALEEVPA